MKQPSVFPMAVFCVPVCLLILGLTGCAGKETAAWQDDKTLVLQSLKNVSDTQRQLHEHSELFDKRLFELEKTVAQQLSAIDAMKATLEAQSKQQEHVEKEAKQAAVVQKAIKRSALVKKLDKIDSDIKQAVITTKRIKKAAYQPAEKNDYTAAYLALKSGRYDEAIVSFQTFLGAYPNGEYADQAYYWLGESLLANSKFLAASESFQILAKQYPKSSKYQIGLLKLGITYEQLKRIGDAKAVWQRLIEEAPQSKSAKDAKLRLSGPQSKKTIN
ncbi:MAG: tol-pal system protein YbgF [Mariprofundaceae bacterium]|nr:tol-pal system protein YbgF [Mariprofundaceae bacterium]